MLSRLPRAADPINRLENRENREVLIMRVNTQGKLNPSRKFKDLQEQQQSVPELRTIAQSAPEIGTLEANCGRFGVKDGILYKKTGKLETSWKSYVPDHMATELITAYHEHLGHSGCDRVSLAIQQTFYIKRLANKCRNIIGACLLCQRTKPLNVKYDVQPAYILSERPNSLICCDIHRKIPKSNFGHQYIFVMYDMFSKFTIIYPMKAIGTRGCLKKIFEDYIPKYGHIAALVSDNASLFSSPVWRKTLEGSNIKCYHPSVYHLQSNPAERALRNITIYLRANCHRNHKVGIPTVR